MKKIIGCISLALFCLTCFSGFIAEKKVPTVPPEMKIQLDNINVDYKIVKTEWDGLACDTEDVFKAIQRNNSLESTPYFKLGNTVTIEFQKNAPAFLEVFDYLLNANGDQRYDSRLIVKVPVKLSKGKYVFELKENMATFLSSNMKDYEPGRTIRGFKVVCKWKNNKQINKCEYGFVIRTDVNKEKHTYTSVKSSGTKVYQIPVSKQKQKYSVEDFRKLYSGYLKLNHIEATTSKKTVKEDVIKLYKINDITPKKVRQEIDCQIFKINDTCETYLVYNTKIFSIGFGFGGMGVVDLSTCDFDANGQKELIYTFSWGSGMHRSHIGIFDLTKEDETWLDFVQLNEDVLLEKLSEESFKVYIADVSGMPDFIHLTLSKKNNVAIADVKKINGKAGVLKISNP